MTVFKRGAFALALAAGAIVLADCGGGGSGSGPGGGPTPYPIFLESPLPTPTSGPTATPTPRPRSSHTPRPAPTPSARPTPTGSPSPTPLPACDAPRPDPRKSNVLLTGHSQELEVPCFESFRATIKLPENNGGGNSPIDVRMESSTDTSLGAPSPSPGSGTPLFYEAFRPGNRLVLHGKRVTFDMSSEKKISPQHTYAVSFYLKGAKLVPTVKGLVSIGNDLSVTVLLPPLTAFPARDPVQIVLYESS